MLLKAANPNSGSLVQFLSSPGWRAQTKGNAAMVLDHDGIDSHMTAVEQHHKRVSNTRAGGCIVV